MNRLVRQRLVDSHVEAAVETAARRRLRPTERGAFRAHSHRHARRRSRERSDRSTWSGLAAARDRYARAAGATRRERRACRARDVQSASPSVYVDPRARHVADSAPPTPRASSHRCSRRRRWRRRSAPPLARRHRDRKASRPDRRLDLPEAPRRTTGASARRAERVLQADPIGLHALGAERLARHERRRTCARAAATARAPTGGRNSSAPGAISARDAPHHDVVPGATCSARRRRAQQVRTAAT